MEPDHGSTLTDVQTTKATYGTANSASLSPVALSSSSSRPSTAAKRLPTRLYRKRNEVDLALELNPWPTTRTRPQSSDVPALKSLRKLDEEEKQKQALHDTHDHHKRH